MFLLVKLGHVNNAFQSSDPRLQTLETSRVESQSAPSPPKRGEMVKWCPDAVREETHDQMIIVYEKAVCKDKGISYMRHVKHRPTDVHSACVGPSVVYVLN